MSTCLLINKPPRQLIYLSARQQISSSTYLLVTLVNKSSRQLIYLSARQQISSSTYLLVRSSTNLLVNLSTCPLFNKPPRQLVNSSTRQLKKKPRHCKKQHLGYMSGLLDSNQRPRRPERRALPTALNPDCLKASAKLSLFFIMEKFLP